MKFLPATKLTCLLTTFVYIVLDNATAHKPYILEAPENVSIAEGSTADFMYVISRSGPEYKMLWFVEKTYDGSITYFDLDAQSQGRVDITPFSDRQHGFFSTWHQIDSDTEEYQLQIANVTQNDDMFRFVLMYVFNDSRTLFSDWLSLTVWIPPKIPLECSVSFPSGNTPNVLPQEGLNTTLKCSL